MTLRKEVASAANEASSLLLFPPNEAFAAGPADTVDWLVRGLSQPVDELSLALVLFAFGLVLGLQSGQKRRWSWIALVLGTTLGLGSAWSNPMLYAEPWISLSLALPIALVAAFDLVLPSKAIYPIAVLVGLIVGVGIMPAPAPPLSMAVFAISACFAGLSIVVGTSMITAGALDLTEVSWLRLGVRVLAAWSAALAILMLALAFRPQT